MSHVYFVRVGTDGPVKIGLAINPKSRISNLQIGHHSDLEIIRTVPGSKAVERWMHKRFAASHIRGEWFEFNHDMLSVEYDPSIDLSPKRISALPMRPSTLRAWIKQRRLKHQEAADLLALSRDGLRKNLYGVTVIGPQTERIVELLDKCTGHPEHVPGGCAARRPQ